MPDTKKYPPILPRDPNDENVVQKELSKGEVRPDGPGDETAPVKPEVEKQHERP